MALTQLQRRICLLLAEQRKQGGESYVAGGAALNELLGATRKSRDGRLAKASPAALSRELAEGRVAFHEGRIKGAFPELRTG